MEIFFYGLFMNVEKLINLGYKVENPRKASLEGYQLYIGNKATLLPEPGATSHGVVAMMSKAELDRLYKQPGVEEYVAEEVYIRLLSGKTIVATCYNIPKTALAGTNPEYARKLAELTSQLGFPEAYRHRILSMQ